MVWWQWLAVAWLGLGAITVLTLECLSRESHVDGPMSQDHPLNSIALSTVFIFSGPFFLLISLWECAKLFWKGQIPILMRPWWPARAARQLAQEKTTQRPDPTFPPVEWLKERVTLTMVESGRPLPYGGTEFEFEMDDGETVVLGGMDAGNSDWEQIKLRMLPDDELWTFNSPPDKWEILAGNMGVALIRNGRPIAHAITARN